MRQTNSKMVTWLYPCNYVLKGLGENMPIIIQKSYLLKQALYFKQQRQQGESNWAKIK